MRVRVSEGVMLRRNVSACICFSFVTIVILGFSSTEGSAVGHRFMRHKVSSLMSD